MVGDDESRAVGWFSEHTVPPLAERFRVTMELARAPPAGPWFGAGRRVLDGGADQPNMPGS
jgi:hypothetical protein